MDSGADALKCIYTELFLDNQSKLQDLAHRPVGRLLWEYSLPAVVGMLVMALYNIVDRVFIGQVVGPQAIAGMTITFPLMNITTAVGVLVGVGAATRISIMMGRRDKGAAERILGNAVTLTFINGGAYMLVFFVWLDPILHAFGTGDLTLPYARSYMLWVLPGLLLTNIAFGLNNVLRATGYPTKAMYTMIIGAVVNVILDAILVLGFDMGMAGAAIATDIAMSASAWFVIAHFFKPNVNLAFRRGTFRLDRRVVGAIMSIGASPFVVNVASCMINVLINRSLAGHGGDMAIGAAGIFVTVTSLAVTIVLGVTMGLQAVIGYNYGAGLYHRLRRAFWLATGVGTIVCTIGALGGLIFPQYLARAFTSDEFLIATTVTCLRHALWAFPVVGFQIISTCLFQSVGMPARAMILSLSRQVLFLIPLMLWLPNVYGVEGVWLSFPLSDILATIVSLVMVIQIFRQFSHYSPTINYSSENNRNDEPAV